MDSSFFNDYIKKNLSDKNKLDKNDTGKTEKICHITFEPLEKNYIIFDCSHTFNYNAIFTEVCIQKTIINNKETQKLKKYCIKCPYCRFIQNGILPYREPYNLIPLVNTPKSKAFNMKKFQCKYTFASGKKKGQCCNKYSEFEYCSQHHKIIEKRKQKSAAKHVNEPVNEAVIEPVNEPVNEIISSQPNIIDNIANAIYKQFEIEKWYETCEKKHTLPNPILNKKNIFISCCSHVFKRGKFKGENCPKFVKTTSKNNSPVYYKNVYCKNHSRLKSNIVQLIDKPFHVPLYKKNLSKKEIDKYYFDFINSEEYDFVENKGFYYKKECYLTNKALIDKENINKLKIKKSTIIMI